MKPAPSIWIASYTGPGGFHGRARLPEWVQAANWLRAMLEALHPDGYYERVRAALAASEPGRPFECTAGRWTFGLSLGEPQPAQASLAL